MESVTTVLHEEKEGGGEFTRTEAYRKALEKIGLKEVEKIVGANLLQKRKEQIKKRILKDSRRYVIFFKSQKIKDGYTFKIKISPESLKKILKEKGFLYVGKRLKLLPMILVTDKKNNKRYGWWFTQKFQKGPYYGSLSSFSSYLKRRLSRVHVDFLEPEKKDLLSQIDESYRKVDLPPEKYQRMYDSLEFPIVLKGYVDLSPTLDPHIYNVSVKFKCIYRPTGSLISYYKKVKKTKIGIFEEVIHEALEETLLKASKGIYADISDYIKKDLFESYPFQILVEGDIFNPKKYKTIETLIFRSKNIKGLEKTIFEKDKIRLFLDAKGKSSDLYSYMKEKEGKDFRVQKKGSYSLHIHVN